MLMTINYQFLQSMTQAYQLGTKQQVSFSRLTQVSSLDFRTQLIYLMNIKLPDMNEQKCQHLRTLAFSLNAATTEDQVRFRQMINKMTTLRLKQLQDHKNNPNYEFERRQTAIKTKTVEKIQPSFSTKIFGCFKHIASSATDLMKEKQERPNTMKEQKVQISLRRLAQVSSLGQNDQFSYLFSLRVERMDEVECRNLRALAFSLDATTEDEIQFRNSIDRMTTLRFRQLERRKQWALDEFEKKPPAKKIDKVETAQPSLVSEIFGYLKRFIFSSPILATAQTDRPNQSSITTTQEEEDKLLQNSSSELSRKSK